MHTERGDGVANPKRRRQDFQDDDVRDLATASERSRLKKALEESTWVLGGSPVGAFVATLHSAGITVLLCSITTLFCTGNLSIPCVVDGTTWIFLRPGRPMISLYGEGDRTTMKFIMRLVECSSSDTISEICPSG
ncbi:hypothetical protein Tco_1025113 [Tanacetum coccineum]